LHVGSNLTLIFALAIKPTSFAALHTNR
jgi:hypothetical protein